ncbi:MAG: TldD/PmbA family protein [Hungatella sp.]|jgi:TldD protein|nr:TldD/PmbA family protein [Hungatella sp.]
MLDYHECVDLKNFIANLSIKTECYLESNDTTRIRLRNNGIEDISKSSITGGQIRYYSNGQGMKRIFSSLRDIRNIYKDILQEEKYMGPYDKNVSGKNYFFQSIANDLQIDIDEIMTILQGINKGILDLPPIEGTLISFGSSLKNTVFINSKGSIIMQQKQDIISNFAGIVKESHKVITYPISIGSGSGYDFLYNAQELIIKPLFKMANTIEKKIIKSGDYPMILDPIASGSLIHEVLGHLLEADNFYEYKELLSELKLGEKIASSKLTVHDCPRIEGLRGSYYYDDEGEPSRDTILIKEGVLNSYMHSNVTAKKFKGESTGNARALNYRFPPIVRMSNIYVEPGDSTLIEMVAKIKYGILIKGLKGASTNIKKFTIIPREAYLIENGKILGRCKDVYLCGDINILKNISMLGNKTEITQGYSCNKYSQRGLPVSYISPYFFIEKGHIEVIE